MTTLLYADFIAGFPEFTDQTFFPVATFNFWALQADDNTGWTRRMTPGQQMLAKCLYVAHNVALARRDVVMSAMGNAPGQVTGALASKSVDKVAASYSATTTIDNAGPWNATLYGQRFYQMMRGINTAMYVPGPSRRGGYGYGYGGAGIRWPIN